MSPINPEAQRILQGDYSQLDQLIQGTTPPEPTPEPGQSTTLPGALAPEQGQGAMPSGAPVSTPITDEGLPEDLKTDDPGFNKWLASGFKQPDEADASSPDQDPGFQAFLAGTYTPPWMTEKPKQDPLTAVWNATQSIWLNWKNMAVGGEEALGNLLQQAPEGWEGIKKLGDWLSNRAKGISEYNEKQIAELDPKVRSPVLKYALDLYESIGFMMPSYAALFMTAPFSNAAVAARAGLGLMGMQVFGKTYSESKRQGLDDAEATKRAMFNTLAETITEIGPFASAIKMGTPFAKRLFQTAFGESIGEAINQYLENAYDARTLKRMSFTDALKDPKLEDVLYAGALGAGMGVGMGLPGHISVSVAKKRLDAAADFLTLNQIASNTTDGKYGAQLFDALKKDQNFKNRTLEWQINKTDAETPEDDLRFTQQYLKDVDQFIKKKMEEIKPEPEKETAPPVKPAKTKGEETVPAEEKPGKEATKTVTVRPPKEWNLEEPIPELDEHVADVVDEEGKPIGNQVVYVNPDLGSVRKPGEAPQKIPELAKKIKELDKMETVEVSKTQPPIQYQAPTANELQGIIRAKHATPHEFDKFSFTKIGTGEGNTAFGWGGYFTEDKDVAEWYSQAIPIIRGERILNITMNGEDMGDVLSKLYDKNPIQAQALKGMTWALERGEVPSVDEYINKLEDEYDAIETRKETTPQEDLHYLDEELKGLKSQIDFIRKEKPNIAVKHGAKILDVELAPDKEDLLDWDESINDQSKKVQEGLRALAKESPVLKEMLQPFERENTTGAAIYRALSQEKGSPEMASRWLASKGIPGIKYRTGTTRHKKGAKPKHNFVIFDERLIRIHDALQGIERPPNEPVTTRATPETAPPVSTEEERQIARAKEQEEEARKAQERKQQLRERQVTRKVKIKETGEEATIKEPVGRFLNRIDRKLKALDALRACLGG